MKERVSVRERKRMYDAEHDLIFMRERKREGEI